MESMMASVRSVLLLLLPPVSVLVVLLWRKLSALARAQFPWPPGPTFRHDELRVARYSRRVGRREEEEEEEEEEEAAAGSTTSCVVCLSGIEEGSEIRELKCRHLFHRGCLDRWLVARPGATCPLCRRRLLLRAAEDYYCYGDEDDEESESDMMILFMACVQSRSAWLWPSS